MHNPILIHHLGLSFPHKICFEAFNSEILFGDRIALIGRNGSGKSSLFNLIRGAIPPTDGEIIIPNNCAIGFVPQIIEEGATLSGGERFQQALTNTLRDDPNLLLLDEPTNHLDSRNREALMRRLNSYFGTLIVITHDIEFLRSTSINHFWHIDQQRIHIFKGHYDDYIEKISAHGAHITKEQKHVKQLQKLNHRALMKEQNRAAKSREKGKRSAKSSKWSPIIAQKNARNAEQTAGSKSADIAKLRGLLNDQRGSIYQPKLVLPNFFLEAAHASDQILVMVKNGAIQYYDQIILENIHLSLKGTERIALKGRNGSGKTSLVNALLQQAQFKMSTPIHNLHIQGDWLLPSSKNIGYLDQYYQGLNPDKTVIETIKESATISHDFDIRDFLNRFLFRKNEEVNARVSALSGGEKARLVLATIALAKPALLILDELTNNLDMETKAHVIQVLNAYTGGLIVISHDAHFLHAIGIENRYEIYERRLRLISGI